MRGLSDQPAGFGAACLVFPPVCGGLSGKLFRSISLLRGIPPVCGGLSVVLSTVTRWLEVFPRVRGVIGRVVHGYPLAGSIPPACGGLSEVFDLIQKGTDVFPRMRGVIALEKQKKPPRQGYSPPCAGVIGYQWGKIFICNVFPPHAGGYQNISGNPLRRILPRMRGLSAKTATFIKTSFCIPPRVRGVIGRD